MGEDNVSNTSIFVFKSDEVFDVSLVKGVLIHIDLAAPEVYERLYKSARKYILIYEYFNPTPVEIEYSRRAVKLFKRDFADEMLEKYLDLKLLNYGFAYKNDPAFKQDNIAWLLLEK